MANNDFPKPRVGTMIKTINGKVVEDKQVKIIGRYNTPIDPDEVQHLASLHCTNKDMAEHFGIGPKLLAQHFRDQIAAGKQQTKQLVRQAQIQMACDSENPNAQMLIWLGKQMLDQHDSKHIDVTSSQPTKEEIEYKLNRITDDIKEELDDDSVQ